MAQLVIDKPSGGQERIALQKPEYTLGREASCSIALRDRKVSRRHARVFRRDDRYWVEDLASANGVLIDGKPITGPRELAFGMSFDIGGFNITLEDERAGHVTTFSLQGITPPLVNQSFILPLGELYVGRVEGSAIVIADASISRKHAMLEVSPTGVVVKDLESSNGTWVNGERVDRRSLVAGDHLRFGNVEFEFLPARDGLSLGFAASGWRRFLRADRGVQIAMVVGLLSVVLLVITIGVMIGQDASPRDHSASSLSLASAYESGLALDLEAAREHMAVESWEEAERSFARVLDRDPIHREARRGMMEAQTNRAERDSVASARNALEAGRPAEALEALRSIRPDAHYAAAAQEITEDAKRAFAKTALQAGRKACKKSEWRECHRLAVLLLEHTPNSVSGQALVSESENAMRAHRIAFTPWAPPRAAGTADSPTIESLYPDDEVRSAVMRYVAGDLDTAVKRAEALADRPGASTFSQRLADFRQAKAAGDGAQIAGDMEQAIRSWEEALAIDAKIVPATDPSALRQEVGDRLAGELYRKGAAAFARGQYAEAYRQWSAGVRNNPANIDLLAGIAQLEELARTMLSNVPARGKLRRDGCSRLRDIKAMTLPESAVHQEAKSRRSSGGCRK